MTKFFSKFFPLMITVFTLCISLSAREWQGLTPAISTRADVVRLFGQCSNKTSPCEFTFKRDTIRIVLNAAIHNQFYQCTKTLPADTVLLIEVTPLHPIPLERLRTDNRLTLLAKGSGFRSYINEDAGLIIKAHRGKVIQLNYFASAADKDKCTDYYSSPIKFVSVVTHCPPITIHGPAGPIVPGEIVTFEAELVEDPKITLVWNLSAGRISSQEGRFISVDTAGISEQKIRVTVQALGSCSVENSIQVNVASKRPL